jgi:hypothetical protein
MAPTLSYAAGDRWGIEKILGADRYWHAATYVGLTPHHNESLMHSAVSTVVEGGTERGPGVKGLSHVRVSFWG